MCKKEISKEKGFLVMWLWKHWTCISCTHALLRSTYEQAPYLKEKLLEFLFLKRNSDI